MSHTLRIRPITGKFLSITIDGRALSIYRVSPSARPNSSGKIPLGTEVDYETGKKILSVTPPVASLIPEIKNGKFVSPFKENDSPLSENFFPPKVPTPISKAEAKAEAKALAEAKAEAKKKDMFDPENSGIHIPADNEDE